MRNVPILEAWEMVNVACCAIAVKHMMPEAHIVMTRNMHLVSSTAWMLHSLQGLRLEPSKEASSSVIKAALLKNLHEMV